jgi:hypothetical protein
MPLPANKMPWRFLALRLSEWSIAIKERPVVPIAIPVRKMVPRSNGTATFNSRGASSIRLDRLTIQAAIKRIIGKFHAALPSHAVHAFSQAASTSQLVNLACH